MAVEFDRKFLAREAERLGEILQGVNAVGLDADQILIRSEVPVVKEFNSIFKTSYTVEELGWESISEWLINLKFSEIDARNMDEYLWTDPDILFDSPPVPGGREVYRALEQLGKEQHIVTSRPPRLEEITRKWFSIWMPWIPQERIHINKDKNVSGREFKAAKINELGLPVFFDDSEGQARVILERTKAHKPHVVLVTSKYDVGKFDHQRLIRIPSMAHLHAFLTGNPI